MAYNQRHDAKTDSNHTHIKRHISRIPGMKVIDLSGAGGGVPDLLIQKYHAGKYSFYLIELKTAKGKLNKLQTQFHAEHHCHVARDLNDIWRILDV